MLTFWSRRFWIASAAIAILAVIWVVCTLLFRSSADLAVAIAGVIEAIFIGIVPLSAHSKREQADTPEAMAEARRRLNSKVRSQAADQAHELTDQGTLRVPWNIAAGKPGRSSVLELARAVETGRQLIIFGEAQSGKTTLATRLTEALAARPGRQPVLLSLSTWNPSRVELKAWLLQTIQTAYGLSSTADARLAEEMYHDGMIIPVFDGLDEMDASARSKAAQAIYQRFGSGPAVLSSIQTPDTERAARIALPLAEIIVLRPVDTAAVSEYLLDEQRVNVVQLGPLASAIVNNPTSAAGQTLSSPLMAWLAKTIYGAAQIRKPAGGVAWPAELADPARFPDAKSIERHLLQSLPIAVFGRYELHPTTPFSPRQADRWLGFLAMRSARRIIGFWEFRSYAPLFRLALLAAATGGCLIAIAGRTVPDLAGMSYFLLLAGAVFGFGWARGYSVIRDKVIDPTRIGYSGPFDGDMRYHSLKLAHGVAAAAVAYASGVAVHLVRGNLGWLFGLTPRDFGFAALTATVLCFAVANLGGRSAGRILLSWRRMDARMGARAGDPLAAIQSDRNSGVAIIGVAVIAFGAAVTLFDWLFLPADAIWDLCLVPVSACVAACMWNEWICFKAAHLWLALRGRLPWRLSVFLQHCHAGGILRKNGNHFEFRHRNLQDSLRTARGDGA